MKRENPNQNPVMTLVTSGMLDQIDLAAVVLRRNSRADTLRELLRIALEKVLGEASEET